MTRSLSLLLVGSLAGAAQAQTRARELGIPQSGIPGPLNAITDVAGVEVGMVTLIRGEGKTSIGKGPVRTGVTAILPRGRTSGAPVFAGWFTLNGNGEMTGTTWIDESGFLGGPVMITNTLSVGAVHHGTIQWTVKHHPDWDWALPVVAETWDGGLNDIMGQHVTPEHAMMAIDSARAGPVREGNVGGGTGMVCNDFKGGTGTSSRRITVGARPYAVGVLVQCNYGRRPRLEVAGVPVGQEIPDLLPCKVPLADGTYGRPGRDAEPCGSPGRSGEERGSIIVVVATDAPLLPSQLKRVARRAALGIGRMGGIGGNSSGDIFIAFSTANAAATSDTGLVTATFIPNDAINPVFEATVDATSEAILNAMLAAETMTGADGYRVYALPHDRLLAALRKYGRVP
ncbi:MAG TPA: P1 family peptidase [Gemmatimonadales bacterium]|nr:P1 family peptidase [Gemmatimonadales bacterium]